MIQDPGIFVCAMPERSSVGSGIARENGIGDFLGGLAIVAVAVTIMWPATMGERIDHPRIMGDVPVLRQRPLKYSHQEHLVDQSFSPNSMRENQQTDVRSGGGLIA